MPAQKAMTQKYTLSIVIPCLNEKKTIASVIKDAQKYCSRELAGKYEIIVADNGSTDGSLTILKRFRRTVRVVNVPIKGYGAALHWGIMAAKGNYVLFGDADCSYPFSNLSRFLEFLPRKPDMVLGSRLRGKIQPGAMPLLNRYFGTPILTLIIRLLYGLPTTDCNSGMRLVKRDFYKSLNMRNSGMEWASELLLKTALKNGSYFETPIRFLKDRRARAPHLSRWSDGWRHLKAIILLKPQSLRLAMMLFLFLSVILYPVSFSLTSLFLLMFIVLFFSLLALQFLAYAIEGENNQVSQLLNSNMLVPWVIMFTAICGGIILLLPDSRLGTKMILIAILSVVYIWTFLIETIKTHVINRLPDNIK